MEKRSGLFLALLLMAPLASAQEYTHLRLLNRAEANPEWKGATVVRKLELIRDEANAEDVHSDPVSDRYSVTFLGGPIDWVHFLNLANFICSGDQKFGEAQYAQWVSEGGQDFEKGRTLTHPTAATPDDLPSNALGALFGRELRAAGADVNIRVALERFIVPLKPVADRIAKKFSRHEIVLGLRENPSAKEQSRAHAWFTAEPLNLTAKLNAMSVKLDQRPLGKTHRTGRDALGDAGFRLINFNGKPVVIERIE